MENSHSPSAPAPSNQGRWRAARHILVAAAGLVTLIAVFYTAENWRGKRAWENCRHELASKGEVLDWAANIPAPVPDDQNFYKAPHMQEWFVRDSMRSLVAQASNRTTPPRPFSLDPQMGTHLVLAEVKVVKVKVPLQSIRADAVLRFDDPEARAQAAKLVSDAIDPCAMGSRGCLLVGRPVEQFKQRHWVLRADTALTVADVVGVFTKNRPSDSGAAWPAANSLQIDSDGANAFRISLKDPVYGAAEYLAWTDPLTADFDLVREALERPWARLGGNYQQPYAMAIPDFVTIRCAAQILTQRAQSRLLLGQPEAAWHELALVRNLCRILVPQPSGKPMTLVAAMINVAVTGLYAAIVEDGLRMHAWGEPQLRAIERQLHDVDLLAPLVEAFREERAATCLTFETTKRSEIVKLFDLVTAPRSWPDQIGEAAFKSVLTCMPRGWFYQNMAVGGALEQKAIDSVDVTNRLVRPGQVAAIVRSLSAASQHYSPYRFLAARALPNFAKALLTAARNQTSVSQAELACALERYRLVQGRNPETLDALSPRYLAKLPHDLIGGRTLRYNLTDSGGYRLYSIGWNEKDDGGVTGESREVGDWVWELP